MLLEVLIFGLPVSFGGAVRLQSVLRCEGISGALVGVKADCVAFLKAGKPILPTKPF
ncbi:MAG: hypothetical protein H6669_00160 [Ardenticatenaceae bacterium]|nr:hypothetical protein [Ardenticatenaceae bacterium]